MKRNILTAGAVAMMLLGAALPAHADSAASGKALVNELAKGGYVIYMRHTKTDKTQKDSDVSNLSDCSKQRNLNDEGRQQAKSIGQAFSQFGIRVGEILASPYCRATETAMIMFGRAQKTDQLRYLTRLSPGEAAEANAWLNKQLAMPTEPGTNRILISHTANLKKATDIWPKNSGDINVFKPDGNGSYTHVGTILVDEWPKLTN
jgi:phosphohistidine phosphatase SixA